MNKSRMSELEMIASNEIKYRGQTAGWGRLQTEYKIYNLTEHEAKIVAHLVHSATVTLPMVPYEMLLED